MTLKYCSIADVRDMTKVTSSEFSDTSITKLIEDAQSDIDEMLKMNFTSGGNSTVEYYDGLNKNYFITRNHPILSITSLHVDDDDDGTYEWSLTGSDYHYDSWGRIVLKEDAQIGYFANYPRSIKLTYVYGYSDVPQIIKKLCKLKVANLISGKLEYWGEIQRIEEKLMKNRIEIK